MTLSEDGIVFVSKIEKKEIALEKQELEYKQKQRWVMVNQQDKLFMIWQRAYNKGMRLCL